MPLCTRRPKYRAKILYAVPGVTGINHAFELSRSLISFAALKDGTSLFVTGILAPVRGLRPVCAFRTLAEKAPNPRISTRSPPRHRRYDFA
jgi:hypothetical protein